MIANSTPTVRTTFFDGLTTCPTSKLAASCSTTTAQPPSTGAPASTTVGRVVSPVASRDAVGGPAATRATNGVRYAGIVVSALPGDSTAPAGSITCVRIPDSKCEATATWARNGSISLVTTAT